MIRFLLFTFAAVAVFASAVPEPEVPVKDIIFIAFDVETTGFSIEQDRIIEIGAVRFLGDGTVLASAGWLINPGRAIPLRATEVHGITDELVSGAPVFSEAGSLFLEFCKEKEGVLLAHNAIFDMRFLRTELERAGIPVPDFPVLDTLTLFRSWFPEAERHSMEHLISFFQLPEGVYHRALADSFHLVNLFKLGMENRPDAVFEAIEQSAGGIRRLKRGDP